MPPPQTLSDRNPLWLRSKSAMLDGRDKLSFRACDPTAWNRSCSSMKCTGLISTSRPMRAHRVIITRGSQQTAVHNCTPNLLHQKNVFVGSFSAYMLKDGRVTRYLVSDQVLGDRHMRFSTSFHVSTVWKMFCLLALPGERLVPYCLSADLTGCWV